MPLEPPITIPTEATGVTIGADGIVSATQKGHPAPTQLGTIQLAHFVNPAGLSSVGHNLLVATSASGEAQVGNPGADGRGTLLQGSLEHANVEMVEEMIELIGAQQVGTEMYFRGLGVIGDLPMTQLLEAAGSLSEGLLYGLSLPQLARSLEAPVVLVHGWNDCDSIDPLLEAHEQLGDLLAGVVLNGVLPDQVETVRAEIVPALQRLGLPVLGVMPRSPLLRSVTVEELSRRLDAQVLCCRDRLDLLVETLSIGAMNVNSAMEFFRRRRNMAVVTGADRTDIQLAALEASTQCLILTGAGEPLPQLISRAEELEVPLLKVEHDTLTTVEVIESTFGHVRLQESVKATYAFRLVEEHCDFAPLYSRLQLSIPA